MFARPFSVRIGVEVIRGGFVETTQQIEFFICPKLMMQVWVRLMFNMDNFVVYSPSGGLFWPYLMQNSFVIGFFLIPHNN